MNAADFPRLPLAQAIEQLALMPAFLEGALAGRSQAALRQRTEAGGEFSLVEHACHLRDLEREGYLPRVRRVLAEERPELAGFPGGAIAIERDYPSQDAFAASAAFARARSELLALLAALEPAQLCRKAVFGGSELTLADVVAMAVDHDRGHRGEIEALVASLDAP